MPDTLYSDALVNVLQEKVTDLAEAGDARKVKDVIADVQKEAAERTPSYVTDTIIYRITVIVLGLSVLLVVAAQFVLALQPGAPKIPEGLIAIGSAAIGALAGPAGANAGAVGGLSSQSSE